MQSTMQRDLAQMVLEVFWLLARFWEIWLEKTCLVGFVLPAVEFVYQHWRCGIDRISPNFIVGKRVFYSKLVAFLVFCIMNTNLLPSLYL
jgi:hypothetical protein